MDLSSIPDPIQSTPTRNAQPSTSGARSAASATGEYVPRALEHLGPEFAPRDVLERSEALRSKLAELKDSFQQERELSAAKIRELRTMLIESKERRRDSLLSTADSILQGELRLPPQNESTAPESSAEA